MNGRRQPTTGKLGSEVSKQILPVRPRKLRRLLAATAAGAVLAGTGIAYAGAARADSVTFLQSLNNNGITIYDASTAVANGWAICDQLNTANGLEVIDWVYVNTSWSDVPTRQTAAVWVFSAVNELCPWHDHRGQAAA